MIDCIFEDIVLPEKGSLISGPFGSNISSKYFVDSGIPVIRGNNLSLSYDKFYDTGFVFVTEDKANELKCDAFADDIIFTAAGTVGQVGIIPKKTKFDRYVISNKQIRARIDTSKVYPLYAYYWLASPWIQKTLTNNDKGSTVPLLTLNEIRNLPFKYPESIDEQKAIANFIDLFSRRIENNENIIYKLESLMKKTFQLWFVQYEFPNKDGKPYKKSGGKMVWNEELKKEIPVGWEVISLSEILCQKKKKPFKGKDTLTIDLSVMPSGTLNIIEYNSSDNFETNLFYLDKGDILFGSIRPYLKKACIAPFDGAFAGTVHNFHPIKEEDRAFLISLLISDFFFDYAVTVSKGTKMPVVAADDLLNYRIAYNPEISKEYNKNDFSNEICRLLIDNYEHKRIRDRLLPLFFSGKILIE